MKLTIDVYYTNVIEHDLKLTQGGLILYSLLAGNDLDHGWVPGVGPITALTVAQCKFGNSLIPDCKELNTGQQLRYFENVKVEISKEVKHNMHGLLRSREPACAQRILDSDLPSNAAMDWFLNPPTSWSNQDPTRTLDIPTPMPRLDHLQDIAQFCVTHIGWSPEVTLARCWQKLWHRVIIRILCLVQVYY